MSSYKERKITQIVREFLKNGDSYNINGITLGIAKYFYREPQGLFQDISTGDYRIDQSSGNQTLVITNQELLGRLESIQIGYVLDFEASKYETEWNVDINTLKDKYNQLVDTSSSLWEYIRKTGMIADDTTIDLILPQLDVDEIWIKTPDGYSGLKVSDFRDMAGAQLIEYIKTEKANINQINQHTVETINTIKQDAMTSVNADIDRITAKVNGVELDLTAFLNTLKAALQQYFDLLNSTTLNNKALLDEALANAQINVNELKTVGSNERIEIVKSGSLQREKITQEGKQWRDEIQAVADTAIGLTSGLQTNIAEAKKVNTTLNTTLTQANATNNSLADKIGEVPVLINNITNAGNTEVGNVTKAGANAIAKVDSAGRSQIISVDNAGSSQIDSINSTGASQRGSVVSTGDSQISRVATEGGAQFNRVNTEGVEKVKAITSEGDRQLALTTAEGTKQLGLITTEGVKQLDSVTGKGKEIIATGNAKIEEIKSLPNGVGVNIKNDKQYRTWLGTVKEFSMIQKKARDVLYHVFDDNFNMVKSYFEELAPVKNGLICWLDGRDGKGTETTWVDRSWDMNSATLTGFSFTQGSGWTSKSLKFDGVKDNGVLDNQNIGWKTLEVDFECYSRIAIPIVSYGLKWSRECLEVTVEENGLIIQGGAFNKNVVVDNTRKNTLQLTYDKNILKIYINGAYATEVAGVTLYETSRFNLGMNTNRTIYGNPSLNAIRMYSRALNDSEIFANYEYDKSIDRTIPVVYPLTGEIESYGIGLSNQLSEEQLKTFRLSNDKTKFVAGLNYCEGLIVDKYTYSKTLEIMETKDWKSEESYIS